MKNNNKETAVKYPIYDNGQLHVSISARNKKLGNIPQFNLLPSNEILKLDDGKKLTNICGTCGKYCKECKSVCYAVRTAKYHHNSCIPAWGRNTVIMRNDPEKLRNEINEYVRKNIVKYFRFHASGALESVDQLRTYTAICNDNEDITFYIYTKEFDILAAYIVEFGPLPSNLVVNLSEWHGNIYKFLLKYQATHNIAEYNAVKTAFDAFNVFAYDDGGKMKDLTHCPAVDKLGHETGVTCAMCRRCMTKGNKTAVYNH